MGEVILPSTLRDSWEAADKVYDDSTRPDHPHAPLATTALTPRLARSGQPGMPEFDADMVSPWRLPEERRHSSPPLAGTSCQRPCFLLTFIMPLELRGSSSIPISIRQGPLQARPGGEENAVCAERLGSETLYKPDRQVSRYSSQCVHETTDLLVSYYN